MTAAIISAGSPNRASTVSEKGVVDGIMRLRRVNEAHVHEGSLASSEVRQTSRHEHNVQRRALGAKPSLSFREEFVALQACAEPVCDNLEKHFFGVCSKGHVSVVAIHSPVLLRVYDLENGALSELRGFSFFPTDDDFVILLENGVALLHTLSYQF